MPQVGIRMSRRIRTDGRGHGECFFEGGSGDASGGGSLRLCPGRVQIQGSRLPGQIGRSSFRGIQPPQSSSSKIGNRFFPCTAQEGSGTSSQSAVSQFWGSGLSPRVSTQQVHSSSPPSAFRPGKTPFTKLSVGPRCPSPGGRVREYRCFTLIFKSVVVADQRPW